MDQPDALPGRALGVGEVGFEEGVLLVALGRTQAPPVRAAAEEIQLMERRIAGLGGDAFGVKRLDETVDRRLGEGPVVVVEEVAVVSVARAAGILSGAFPMCHLPVM